MNTEDREKKQTELASQGQDWSNLPNSFSFKRPRPLFDQPMDISITKLRGLRMVDETVVVHGQFENRSNKKEGSQ